MEYLVAPPPGRTGRLCMAAVAALVCLSPFTGRGQSVEFFSSNLPILMIDTEAATIPDEPKIEAWLAAVDNGVGVTNHVSDPPTAYNGHVGIEMRGSSSLALFDKKSYALETRLADGSNVSLLGLPVENDWVLHGPYGDKTLIRNALTYELYRRMGRYASAVRFCELLINREYLGVYVLLEKVKRDNDRVDITPIEPGDISGDAIGSSQLSTASRRCCPKHSEETSIDGRFSMHMYGRTLL